MAADLDDDHRHSRVSVPAQREKKPRREGDSAQAPAGRDGARSGRAGSWGGGEERRGEQRRAEQRRERRGVFTERAKGTPNVVRDEQRT